MEEIKNGTSNYHFIEVMTCPGGCIMGGGQPLPNAETREKIDVRERRANCLYSIDEKSTIRKAHENQIYNKCIRSFLKK